MINKIKETIPPQLKKYNLMVNETKTEQYQTPRLHPDLLPIDLTSALDQNDIRWSALGWIINAKQTTPVNKEPDWRKCKLLGSLLDASADITRRKMIALEHMKTFKIIFDSHKLKTGTKVRTFNTYVATIFLYNSETWTITQTLEYQIDSCHRRLLREAALPENHYQRRNISGHKSRTMVQSNKAKNIKMAWARDALGRQ